MDSISFKLIQTQPELNCFEDNQVLTAEQLNTAENYFDYNDRITRTHLIGIGIVCGLHILYDKKNIILTKGSAITSDGDLIVAPLDKNYTKLIAFKDKNAHYLQFRDAAKKQINLWELLPADTKRSEALSFESFFVNDTIESNYSVLLYLEQYMEEKDNCSAESCDNKGCIQKSNLKILLIAKSDIDSMNLSNICCSDQYFDMPEVEIHRPLLNPGTDHFSFDSLASVYQNAITSSINSLSSALTSAQKVAANLAACSGQVINKPKINISRLVNTIHAFNLNNLSSPVSAVSGIQHVARDFIINPTIIRPGLLTSINSDSNVASAYINKITEVCNTFTNKPGIQYVHDYIKDIAVAYDEFKESVFDICCSCVPDANQFPKHILAGELVVTDTSRPSNYRQSFCESPIVNNKIELLDAAIHLYERIGLLINNFDFLQNVKEEIKVTPSKKISDQLGQRAIPFYYNTSNIINNWSFEKAKRNKINTVLSYEAAKYSNLNKTVSPLQYDIDTYDFFRIEGHIGKNYDVVYSKLNELRRSFDLPFDIIGLQLEQNLSTVSIKHPIYFPALETLRDHTKNMLLEHLDHVTSMNQAVVNKIPTNIGDVMKGITGEDITNVSATIFNSITNGKSEADAKVEEAKVELNKESGAINYSNFISSYAKIAAHTAAIHTNASELTAAINISPVHTPLHFNPNLISWIDELIAVEKDKVKQGYIFTNYLKQNPALLHNGGVSKGGTFVIVYNDISKNVVADFYLPYINLPEYKDPEIKYIPKPLAKYRPVPFETYIHLDVIKPGILQTITTKKFNALDNVVKIPEANPKYEMESFDTSKLVLAINAGKTYTEPVNNQIEFIPRNFILPNR